MGHLEIGKSKLENGNSKIENWRRQPVDVGVDTRLQLHTVGPAPGPLWLTRSRFVSSYWRGRSLPVLPSQMARYSLPKSVVEFAKALLARPLATLASVPGEVSL